jgi:hypothetical protein
MIIRAPGLPGDSHPIALGREVPRYQHRYFHHTQLCSLTVKRYVVLGKLRKDHMGPGLAMPSKNRQAETWLA